MHSTFSLDILQSSPPLRRCARTSILDFILNLIYTKDKVLKERNLTSGPSQELKELSSILKYSNQMINHVFRCNRMYSCFYSNNEINMFTTSMTHVFEHTNTEQRRHKFICFLSISIDIHITRKFDLCNTISLTTTRNINGTVRPANLYINVVLNIFIILFTFHCSSIYGSSFFRFELSIQ